MENMITTNSLTKLYGTKPVVHDLALKVPQGSIYGFLGPNGAGKSTTMKMLLGLVKPSAGSIFILGKPVVEENRLEILKNTGSLIESPSYYGKLFSWHETASGPGCFPLRTSQAAFAG